MKEGGRGWGNVFREMKTQGLVDAKNLGSVVSASSKHHTSTASKGGSSSSTTSGTTGGTTTTSTTASATSGNGKASGSSGKGGYKSSGHGKDLSMYGFDDYTRIKHVMAYTG